MKLLSQLLPALLLRIQVSTLIARARHKRWRHERRSSIGQKEHGPPGEAHVTGGHMPQARPMA